MHGTRDEVFMNAKGTEVQEVNKLLPVKIY